MIQSDSTDWSALQTAGGKVIFGKLDENGRGPDAPRPGAMEMALEL